MFDKLFKNTVRQQSQSQLKLPEITTHEEDEKGLKKQCRESIRSFRLIWTIVNLGENLEDTPWTEEDTKGLIRKLNRTVDASITILELMEQLNDHRLDFTPLEFKMYHSKYAIMYKFQESLHNGTLFGTNGKSNGNDNEDIAPPSYSQEPVEDDSVEMNKALVHYLLRCEF